MAYDIPSFETVRSIPPLRGALPGARLPYALEHGDGHRYDLGRALVTVIARPEDTGGSFFALHTSGGRSPYIPRHVHRLHTENFLCLQGRILLHGGGQEIALHPGDFLHAPAGTIHSFSFAAHHTQMLGILTTDVFEPFFDRMNRPTDAPVHQEIGDRAFPAEAFGRVQAELDVEVVGPPPASRSSIP